MDSRNCLELKFFSFSGRDGWGAIEARPGCRYYSIAINSIKSPGQKDRDKHRVPGWVLKQYLEIPARLFVYWKGEGFVFFFLVFFSLGSFLDQLETETERHLGFCKVSIPEA